LGIGTAGQVLTVNSGATAPQWSSPSVFATNLLLNSNFALNQRTYVSAANLASGSYGFDRWKSNFTNTTLTFTASTQGQSVTINSGGGLQQIIERGLVPAGTYTLSWTGTATGRVYNSGGTPPAYAASPVTFTADGLANVVVEYTATGATKTLSQVQFNAGTNTTWYLATPTLQTELAACQRYYYRLTADATNPAPIYGFGTGTAATSGRFGINLLATMRTTPSSIDFNSLGMSDGVNATTAITALALLTNGTATNNCGVNATTASGITTYRPYFIVGNGASGAYLGLSAEL
jgi:hypothetical protein